jgi:hypothetical protein
MCGVGVTADRVPAFTEHVMHAFPQPHYMPCAECGASVARAEEELHACDPERRLDFVCVQLRDECARFEEELGAFLASARGRFEAWYASQRR